MAIEQVKSDEYKWEVENAASTLIAVGPINKRIKKDEKFRKAVKAELKRRLKEKESEVVAAKAAIKNK